MLKILDEPFIRPETGAANYPDATTAWVHQLNRIFTYGQPINPRGMPTLEILHNTFSFDMNYPIAYHQDRKLSYVFLAAEAQWICAGSNLLSDIEPYNSHISKFSDDGEYLSGAYGIPFSDQFDYVLNILSDDPDTRQAVMTIWKSNPQSSKDIPCTVSLIFKIRNSEMHTFATMRSSDAWLGLPYDMFSFTMMTLKILTKYNTKKLLGHKVTLGKMFVTLCSSHLYEINLPMTEIVLNSKPDLKTIKVPEFREWDFIDQSLTACKNIEDTTHLWGIRPCA